MTLEEKAEDFFKTYFRIDDDEYEFAKKDSETTISLMVGFAQKENADLQHRLDVAQGFLDRDKEYQELKNRNVELKGKYAHAAREAETYKQFWENQKETIASYDTDLNKAKEENESLQQKYLSESYEKSKLVSENNKLLDVINNQDVKIADLEEKLKTSLDYNKSLLNALKNSGASRLNSGLIERAENYIKEN